MSRWTSSSPKDVNWRREQMSANNDIEGVARDAGADKVIEQLDASNAPAEKRREVLRAYFAQKAK